MRTVICTNETCPQNQVPEYFIGDPDLVMCGVCRESCELSELYDDPELPRIGEP